jgi:hypothetical protein
MAGETQNYHETRNPFHCTADFTQITLSTTSLMTIAAAQMAGSPLVTAPGYWDLGKKIQVQMFGKITTGATPGNLVVEIRYGTTDNAGTILATSAATALAATKSNISWFLEAQIESRAFIGTASGLFAWGRFMYDGAGALFTTTSQNPMLIPASLAAAVNVDTSVASGINIQMKRSGSTAETVTVQDLQVNALT